MLKAIPGRWYRWKDTHRDSAVFVVAVVWNDDNDGVEVIIRKRSKNSSTERIMSPSEWFAYSSNTDLMPLNWEPKWINHWRYTEADLKESRERAEKKMEEEKPSEAPKRSKGKEGFVRLF